MKPSIGLKIASGLYAFISVAHTLGEFFSPSRGSEEDALIDALKTYRFDMMGLTRSHWDFYRGFSLTISLTMALIAIICWQLSRMIHESPKVVQSLLTTVFMISLALSIVFWAYIFAAPGLTASLATVFLGVALLKLKRS